MPDCEKEKSIIQGDLHLEIVPAINNIEKKWKQLENTAGAFFISRSQQGICDGVDCTRRICNFIRAMYLRYAQVIIDFRNSIQTILGMLNALDCRAADWESKLAAIQAAMTRAREQIADFERWLAEDAEELAAIDRGCVGG